MKKAKLTDLIAENAKKLSTLFHAINSTEEGMRASRKFHSSYDILAFPGGLNYGLKLLKAHDPATIDVAIEFLNADPYFYRSGYIKEQIAHVLKQVYLNPEQIDRIRIFLLASILQAHRREFRQYCRLAAKVSDSQFHDQILALIEQSQDKALIKRARLMADAVGQKS